MSQPSPPPSPPVELPDVLRPLTCAKKDGKPYKRFDDVETEILKTLAVTPSEWNPAKLKSQTLVYLLRWLMQRRDIETIGRLVDVLGRRICRIASDFARELPNSVAEEFVNNIAADINILIFQNNPTRRGEYLEINFRGMVEGISTNARVKLNARLAKEISNSELSKPTSEEGEQQIYDPLDETPLPDEQVIINELVKPEMIQRLLIAITDPRHREAVILRYLKGWPITAKKAEAPSLITYFKVKDRTIRNWLATARKQMGTVLGEKI